MSFHVENFSIQMPLWIPILVIGVGIYLSLVITARYFQDKD